MPLLSSVFAKTFRENWRGWAIGVVSLAAIFALAMSIYRDIDLGIYTSMPEVFRSMVGIPEEADVGSLSISAFVGSYGAMTIGVLALAMGSCPSWRVRRTWSRPSPGTTSTVRSPCSRGSPGATSACCWPRPPSSPPRPSSASTAATSRPSPSAPVRWSGWGPTLSYGRPSADWAPQPTFPASAPRRRRNTRPCS